jgi:hypothetical protein
MNSFIGSEEEEEEKSLGLISHEDSINIQPLD